LSHVIVLGLGGPGRAPILHASARLSSPAPSKPPPPPPRLASPRRHLSSLQPVATPALEDSLGPNHIMRFAGWYLKIAAVGASIGAAMELFMIHTVFCTLLAPPNPPPTLPLVISSSFF